MNARRLYKFRAVTGEPVTDRAVDALMKSYAIFSGRKAFNDLFDSKIEFIYPMPTELLNLLDLSCINARAKALILKWVSSGQFTPNGASFMRECEAAINKVFDSYAIYSLSSHNDCSLLWAHYAACHTGFCIEFEFAAKPAPASYQERIGSFALLDAIKSNLSLLTSSENEAVAQRIHDALLVKLRCWSYEGEYRWIATEGMGTETGRLPEGTSVMRVPYDHRQVKAVIFGCRTPPELKMHIREKLPFNAEFRQAVEKTSCIEIVPFDERRHL